MNGSEPLGVAGTPVEVVAEAKTFSTFVAVVPTSEGERSSWSPIDDDDEEDNLYAVSHQSEARTSARARVRRYVLSVVLSRLGAFHRAPGAPGASPVLGCCRARLYTRRHVQGLVAVPLPTSARCPWISRGVVDAAQESPLVRALVQRTRMAAPFGPGSWPERFTVPEPGDDVFGWTDAVIFSATVRIDPDRAKSWLPRPLLRVANDTARVFVAWYERLERQESRSHDDTSAPHTNNHFHLLAPDPLRTAQVP